MRRAVTALAAVIAMIAPASPAIAHHDAAQQACAKWAPLMRANGLPVEAFTKICYRESRGIARAIGWNYKPGTNHKNCRRAPADTYRKCPAVSSFDLGIWQINSTWVTVTKQVCRRPDLGIFALLEPSCNAAVAGYLYRNGGLGHWRATSGHNA